MRLLYYLETKMEHDFNIEDCNDLHILLICAIPEIAISMMHIANMWKLYGKYRNLYILTLLNIIL